ncbi:hypothetical protein RIEGSTA812A_PEG_835 [invertebrate metagenome]|uniref:Uncharacterized protein n=1 Tax=invertebrate metagenome TaxID=1711999 RepID=A0A484HC28_9ZZZZ
MRAARTHSNEAVTTTCVFVFASRWPTAGVGVTAVTKTENCMQDCYSVHR